MKVDVIKSRTFKKTAKKASAKPGILETEKFFTSFFSAMGKNVTSQHLMALIPKRFQRDANIASDLANSYRSAENVRVFQKIDGLGFPTVEMHFFKTTQKTSFFLFEIGFNPKTGEPMRYFRYSPP